MNIIGQNGNDGTHYDKIETPEERKAERVKAPTPVESPKLKVGHRPNNKRRPDDDLKKNYL